MERKAGAKKIGESEMASAIEARSRTGEHAKIRRTSMPRKLSTTVARAIDASSRLEEHAKEERTSMPRSFRDRESSPEDEPNTAVVGSLVTIHMIEAGKEGMVYISQFETKAQELAEDIREKLPEVVLIQPYRLPPDSNGRTQPRLVDEIYGKSVDDTIELLNGKKAKIVAISFVGY